MCFAAYHQVLIPCETDLRQELENEPCEDLAIDDTFAYAKLLHGDSIPRGVLVSIIYDDREFEGVSLVNKPGSLAHNRRRVVRIKREQTSKDTYLEVLRYEIYDLLYRSGRSVIEQQQIEDQATRFLTGTFKF